VNGAVARAGGPPMVWGWRKAAVRSALWGRIAWLTLRRCRGPRRTLRALRKLATLRPPDEPRPLKYARAGGRYFWSFYAPGFPSRAFDRFVGHELERVLRGHGAEVLQTAIVAITKRCPLRCDHCCEWAALNRAETLHLQDLLVIVRRLQDEGVPQVFLSGGEPLQRFADLLRLVRAVRHGSDLWILTSGFGLTPARAQALAQAGLTGVALSLDHWQEAAHDRLRGLPGSYAALRAAAGAARQAGLLVALSLCPRREIVGERDLERYAEEAGRLGAGFIQILEPRPVGRYAGLDVELSTAQQLVLERFQQRLNRDPGCRKWPAVSYVAAAQRQSRCLGAGQRYLYVDTDGDIHACPFCRESAGSALAPDFEGVLEALRGRGCPRAACAREREVSLV
jgi:MoaA/NifB/PqqE/SkfB family radical SAM enzyme